MYYFLLGILVNVIWVSAQLSKFYLKKLKKILFYLVIYTIHLNTMYEESYIHKYTYIFDVKD